MFNKFKQAWNEEHDPSEGNPLKIVTLLITVIVLVVVLISLYYKLIN